MATKQSDYMAGRLADEPEGLVRSSGPFAPFVPAVRVTVHLPEQGVSV